jgi:hypothetical protein
MREEAMNIYALPFDTTIEVSSSHRFVLVREFTPHLDSHVVLDSDDLSRVEQEYQRATDYVIDQTTGLVTYCFNGITEVFHSRNDRKRGQVDDLGDPSISSEVFEDRAEARAQDLPLARLTA